MEALRALGEDVWFNLGDRDLAICLARARRLAAGERLTDVRGRAAARAYGVRARVLPASDDPVRTRVRAGGAWHDFQAYMIEAGAPAPVEDVEFARRGRGGAVARGARGAARARAR